MFQLLQLALFRQSPLSCANILCEPISVMAVDKLFIGYADMDAIPMIHYIITSLLLCKYFLRRVKTVYGCLL